MLEESIEMMKRLWTEEEVTFKGRYYTLTGAKNVPGPVQKPHPPFLIGGHGGEAPAQGGGQVCGHLQRRL